MAVSILGGQQCRKCIRETKSLKKKLIAAMSFMCLGSMASPRIAELIWVATNMSEQIHEHEFYVPLLATIHTKHAS